MKVNAIWADVEQMQESCLQRSQFLISIGLFPWNVIN